MIILLNYFSNSSKNHPNYSTNKNGQIKGFGRTAINLIKDLVNNGYGVLELCTICDFGDGDLPSKIIGLSLWNQGSQKIDFLPKLRC